MDVAARLEAVEIENQRLRNRVEILERECGMTMLAPMRWGLTAHEAKLLGVLCKRPAVTKDGIMAALYRDEGRDEPEIKIVDVFVCKLRRKLTPFGVEIKTLWGQGYSMDAENKRRVAEAMAEEQGG